MKQRSAFTIIELMIVVGIVAIISTVSLVLLQGRRSRAELEAATQQLVTVLRDAQSRSVSGLSSSVWGVHFDNTTSTSAYYALFRGAYSTSTEVARYRLANSLQFSSSTVAEGSTLDITFAVATGLPSTSTAITLELEGGGATGNTPASVGRSSTGKIFFDDFNRSSL